ncbi:c-type cytochrome [Sphingosinicella xenopeptidilytica]|uniref:C-type cytochrome n=1 Tax=Sphingosinicella xenopeptidilytica TaxID=364098 RepID=A0ABW3C8D9_SPHXN
MIARALLAAGLIGGLTAAGVAAVGVENAARARSNYMLKCQGCHRPDGGETVGSTPALKDFMSKFLSVEGGREYLVRVPGVALSPLSDKELAELLNWSLATFDPANMPADFKPYTAAEMAALRKRPLRTDAAAARAVVVARMNEQQGQGGNKQ